MSSQMQLNNNASGDIANIQIFDKDPNACVFFQSSLPEISYDDSSENWTISGIQNNYNEHKETKDADVTRLEKGKFNDGKVMIFDQEKNDYGEVMILEQSSCIKEISLCTTNEKCLIETCSPIVLMRDEVLTGEQISVTQEPCSLEEKVHSPDEEQTMSVKLETSRSITENACDIVNEAKEVHSESQALDQEHDEQVKCQTSIDVLMELDAPVLKCNHLKDAQDFKLSLVDAASPISKYDELSGKIPKIWARNEKNCGFKKNRSLATQWDQTAIDKPSLLSKKYMPHINQNKPEKYDNHEGILKINLLLKNINQADNAVKYVINSPIKSSDSCSNGNSDVHTSSLTKQNCTVQPGINPQIRCAHLHNQSSSSLIKNKNLMEQSSFSIQEAINLPIQGDDPYTQNISSSANQVNYQIEPSRISVQGNVSAMHCGDPYSRCSDTTMLSSCIVEQNNFSVRQFDDSTIRNCNPYNQLQRFSVKHTNSAIVRGNPYKQSSSVSKQFSNSLKQSDTYRQSSWEVIRTSNSLNQNSNETEYMNFSVQQDINLTTQWANPYNNESSSSIELSRVSVIQDIHSSMKNDYPNKQNNSSVKRFSNSHHQICNSLKRSDALEEVTIIKNPYVDSQSSIMINQGRTHLATNYSEIEKEKNFHENFKQLLLNNGAQVSFRQQMDCKPIDDIKKNICEGSLTSSIDLEIIECVKNWRRKYTWLLYENGIFTCANCRSSPPIYKIEKIDQKFFVSGKLCAHDSSITHNASFLRHNKNILLLIIRFIKSPLLQYDSKEILYAALVKFLNNNAIFTITEQSLPALIEAAAFLLEECEFTKYKVRAINGISFIIDQCRRILVIRSFNTAGQIVESLVPKFLNNESSFDDILSKFSENVVHCKYVYCENCDICVKHSNTLPGIDNLNTVPLRYSSIQSLIEVLQMDPSVQNYVICLRSIRNLTATNFNHWTDMKNFILLKSFNLQLLNKFLYIDTIIKLVEWVKVVKEQRFVSNTNLISFNILLPRLKNILSAWTIKYIDFLLHELEYKFYSVGLSQTELFECLYDLQFRANISQNNSALQVLTQIFSLFNQNNVPVESPSCMINYLAEFGNFIHNQMPSLEYSILNYLAKFQEDEILRNRFGVVHKFYKMFSLLPCFGASKIISLNDIAFIFSALVERFDRPFAIQIMQIRNTVLKAP